MFDLKSRYAKLETTTRRQSDGREVVYVRRRFLPQVKPGLTAVEHVVAESERLDHITARYLGDPELFWQLCDVNRAMRPEELTEEIGRRLRVALLGF